MKIAVSGCLLGEQIRFYLSLLSSNLGYAISLHSQRGKQSVLIN